MVIGVTKHQIGPLDDDDGHEKGRVTGVLQNFPIAVGPLLNSISPFLFLGGVFQNT